MGDSNRVLAYQRSGGKLTCRLFDFQQDVALDSNYLKIRDGSEYRYAGLLSNLSAANASYRRYRKDGTTYALAFNAYYPPDLTGRALHEVHITSGTSGTNYANSYYFRIPSEFVRGSSTSTNTATDSYAYITQHAGGGGNSYFVIYGWNGSSWVALRSYSYSRTLLQGAGDRAEYQYFHSSAFSGYTDFYLYVRANQYSNTNIKVYLRNEAIPTDTRILTKGMDGSGDYVPIMLAGKDTASDTSQCGRRIVSIAQNGNYARVTFASNVLSKRGETEWYPFAAVGDKVIISGHGLGGAQDITVSGVTQRILKIQNIYYPAAGTETGGYMDLYGENGESVTVNSAGTAPMMVWRLDDGHRVVA